MLDGLIKHFLHCCLFAFVVFIFTGGISQKHHEPRREDDLDSAHAYGTVTTVVLYILKLLPILWLPPSLATSLGLVLYNAFSQNVKLKAPVSKAPFICVRVVTRGDYPELVRKNVILHVNTCLAVGMKHFVVEVVTQKHIHLPANSHVREVLVPESYRTNSGALFKARNLQYCLEEGINKLKDDDWILHLDEETLLTENSVRGVLNFIADGRCQIGQGLITYANQNIKNVVTTFADNARVTMDMGIQRLQFKMFHKPLWYMKGSFILALAGAERRVSFDHGIDGSITEDVYFGMAAYRDGYQFDFIEGEVWEESPLTAFDFVQQRKRWLQGGYLVAMSDKIPMRNKFFMILGNCALLASPLITLSYILAYFIPLPRLQFVNFVANYVLGVHVYAYIFGFLKSFHSQCLGFRKLALYLLVTIALIPVYTCLEFTAAIWAIFGEKRQFYVVAKAQ